MGYFREQSNSENIQKSNKLTIFYFGIPYCTLCLPLLPPTFCMKDAQYLISVRKLTINFLVAWEQGAAGCRLQLEYSQKNNNNNLYLLHVQVCEIVLTLKVAPTLIKAGQA